MAKRRTTFGKLQREREKQEKQAAKRERRASMETEETPAPASELDEQSVMDALASLHQRYDAGLIELDELELRREELRRKLDVG